jgi:hypothetical protein
VKISKKRNIKFPFWERLDHLKPKNSLIRRVSYAWVGCKKHKMNIFPKKAILMAYISTKKGNISFFGWLM